MAVFDRKDLYAGIRTALAGDATVTSLLGSPPRIYLFPAKNAQLPFVRLDSIGANIAFEVFGTGNPNRIRNHRIQITIVTQKTGSADAAAIQRAVALVLDNAPNTVTVSNAQVIQVVPSGEFVDFEEETGNMIAMSDYEFTVQSL